MVTMRLRLDNLGKIKNVLHGAQATLIVLAIIVTIAVFTTSGTTDGRTGWFFGLCFLSIPLLIYLTMVPAWSRAKKFANIYAFVTLDGFGAVAWLSAWAAVTSYVVQGKGHGEVKDKSGCENFKFGSKMKCRLSEASIVLGVFIMLLFVATAVISFKGVMEYSRTGVMPGSTGASGGTGGAKRTGGGGTGTGHGDEEEAFDSNMNLRHEWEVEEYDHDDYHDRYGSAGHDGRQGGGGAGGNGGYGYGPAQVDDHGDDYDDRPQDYQLSSGDGSGHQPFRSSSHLGTYSDEQDLTSHRPASTGPGPLGSDTAYHSPSYGHGNTYGR